MFGGDMQVDDIDRGDNFPGIYLSLNVPSCTIHYVELVVRQKFFFSIQEMVGSSLYQAREYLRECQKIREREKGPGQGGELQVLT